MVKQVKNPHLLRFGMNVRSCRKQQGYSQEGFAERARVHRTYMGGIERGERNPTLTTMISIAKALGVPFDLLLDGLLPVPFRNVAEKNEEGYTVRTTERDE